MTETILGWIVISSALIFVSGCLIIPVAKLVERHQPMRRPARTFRAVAIAAGAIALWFAIPDVVRIVYLRL